MPLDLSENFPPAADSSMAMCAALDVADAAARLSLPQDSAKGRIIIQADDGSNWCLRPFGIASNPNDWLQLSLVPVTLGNRTLVAPLIKGYTENPVAIGNTGTAQTIDLGAGTVQEATLTGNCAFTLPTVVNGKSFTLLLNTGAGSFTATFATVDWGAAGAPTITPTAGRLDILTFIASPTGTKWLGGYAQGFTP